VLNKKTVDSLIKAGAFDGTGETRKGLSEAYEAAIDAILPRKRLRESGQRTLFEELRPGGWAYPDNLAVNTEEWDRGTLMDYETEMLGLCISNPSVFPNFVVDVPVARCTPLGLASMRYLMERHPGYADVSLRLTSGRLATVVRWPLSVDPEAPALAGLKLRLDSDHPS
jgi:hypothetical protein